MKNSIAPLVCGALVAVGLCSCDDFEAPNPYHARIIGMPQEPPHHAKPAAPAVQKPAPAAIPAPTPQPEAAPETAPRPSVSQNQPAPNPSVSQNQPTVTVPAPAPRPSVSQKQPRVHQHARVQNPPRRTNSPVSQKQPIVLPAQRVSSGVRY